MAALRRLITFTFLTLLIASSAAHASLLHDVEMVIRQARLGDAVVAVSIRDASGDELIDIKADRPMMPASNMKLLTTGAALHVLGPEHEFQTKLLLDGDRLIVVGDGDPAFGDPDLLEQMTVGGSDDDGLDVEQFLRLWTDAVVKSGVRTLSEVVVDDRIFDREFVHPTWPADQLNARYCAQVSGLTFYRNVLHFFPKPTSGARPDISHFVPKAGWLDPMNMATCRQGPKDSNQAWVSRKLGTNEMTMRSNVKFAYRVPVPVTVHDMPSFFARLLAERLEDRGIEVGEYRVSRLDEPPSTGDLVGPVVATPISTIIELCNVESQNLYAECLLKRIGHELTGQPGSWTNGSSILRHVVHDRIGDPSSTAGLECADGSGLSRANRIAPQTMTAFLQTFIGDERLEDAFISSLAVANESGTLERRFGKADLGHAMVQAKTGYINGVSCLSGYVTLRDGSRMTFSVMVNDLSRSAISRAKKMQEGIVEAIIENHQPSAVSLGSD